MESDDYVSIWFKTLQLGKTQPLTIANVFPEIDGFAAPLRECAQYRRRRLAGSGFKLPPGILPGFRADVKLSIAGSSYSDAITIAVDIDPAARPRTAGAEPPAVESFMIEILTDGKTWERDRTQNGSPCVRSRYGFAALPRGSREDVIVRLNELELASVFVSEPDRTGLRQINALVPTIDAGQVNMSVAVGALKTPSVSVQILPA